MVTLCRHNDRAAMDVPYNARATVPDIPPILKKYATDSAIFKQRGLAPASSRIPGILPSHD